MISLLLKHNNINISFKIKWAVPNQTTSCRQTFQPHTYLAYLYNKKKVITSSRDKQQFKRK